MAIQYSLVPREMMRNLFAQQNAPRDIDEYVYKKTEGNIRKLHRLKKMDTGTKQQKYMMQLRNLIRQKRQIQQKPVRVEVTNLKKPVFGETEGSLYFRAPAPGSAEAAQKLGKIQKRARLAKNPLRRR